MASRIEHHAKKSAYEKCIMWGEDLGVSKDDMLWSERQNLAAHESYCADMVKTGRYWYGKPPRNRFLNWVAHKLLEFCWATKDFINGLSTRKLWVKSLEN